MRLGEPANKKSKQMILGVNLFLAFLFILLFWNEMMWAFLGIAPAGENANNAVLPPGLFIFGVGFGSFLLVFIIWTLLLSFQSLLPITNILKDPMQCLHEAYRTAWHLLMFMFHMHGPAVFVKNGQVNETGEDLLREDWPGVVVVDFNSAVVLEERNPPAGLAGAFINIIMMILAGMNILDGKKSPRVCGPGIVFTRPRERIRGTIDLRTHFMRQPQVRCYTREGIELYAPISVGFTVGQDPEILQVTYLGDPCPENLCVVMLEDLGNGRVRIKDFLRNPDEIDAMDRKEIHTFAQSFGVPLTLKNPPPRANRIQQTFGWFTALPRIPEKCDFNPQRVFAAVFAQARNGNQEQIPWNELPTRVAAGFYREILSHINYDELYDVKETRQFPLPDYKYKLKLAMRNNGILAYRLIFAHNGEALEKGREYLHTELKVSPVMPLTGSKVLRDRGIKILIATFGELAPVNEAVYRMRLESWRASWDRDLDVTLATRDLEAMRERSRARSEAQQELWFSLSQIFEQREFTDEAIALRVLESLEKAATDPKTRALLPDQTIQMMSYIHNALMGSNENYLPSSHSIIEGNGRVR